MDRPKNPHPLLGITNKNQLATKLRDVEAILANCRDSNIAALRVRRLSELDRLLEAYDICSDSFSKCPIVEGPEIYYILLRAEVEREDAIRIIRYMEKPFKAKDGTPLTINFLCGNNGIPLPPSMYSIEPEGTIGYFKWASGEENLESPPKIPPILMKVVLDDFRESFRSSSTKFFEFSDA